MRRVIGPPPLPPVEDRRSAEAQARAAPTMPPEWEKYAQAAGWAPKAQEAPEEEETPEAGSKGGESRKKRAKKSEAAEEADGPLPEEAHAAADHDHGEGGRRRPDPE